jgi:hypothetical protein
VSAHNFFCERNYPFKACYLHVNPCGMAVFPSLLTFYFASISSATPKEFVRR